MLECWQQSPDLRPSFESLRDRMKDMEKRHKVRNISSFTIGSNIVISLYIYIYIYIYIY